MANKHVGTSLFKEEYMQPLQPFALEHLDQMQVSELQSALTVLHCQQLMIKNIKYYDKGLGSANAA